MAANSADMNLPLKDGNVVYFTIDAAAIRKLYGG